jgi:hypothetical protein
VYPAPVGLRPPHPDGLAARELTQPLRRCEVAAEQMRCSRSGSPSTHCHSSRDPILSRQGPSFLCSQPLRSHVAERTGVGSGGPQGALCVQGRSHRGTSGHFESLAHPTPLTFSGSHHQSLAATLASSHTQEWRPPGLCLSGGSTGRGHRWCLCRSDDAPPRSSCLLGTRGHRQRYTSLLLSRGLDITGWAQARG